jgi:hypothetical protein
MSLGYIGRLHVNAEKESSKKRSNEMLDGKPSSGKSKSNT